MKLSMQFSESLEMDIAANFEESTNNINANFGEILPITEFVGGEPYKGEYVVTPKVDAQSMLTKGKVMVEDVLVKAIPFFDVSNTSGGSTVYIAKEI